MSNIKLVLITALMVVGVSTHIAAAACSSQKRSDKAFAQACSVKSLLEAGKLKANKDGNTYYYLAHKQLQSLDGLQEIPDIEKMKSLALSGNQLKVLSAGAFKMLEELDYLDLRENPLKVVEKGAFIGLPKLNRVLLSSDLDPRVMKRIKEEAVSVNSSVRIELFTENPKGVMHPGTWEIYYAPPHLEKAE